MKKTILFLTFLLSFLSVSAQTAQQKALAELHDEDGFKSEQTNTLSVSNKNLREVLVAFIPDFAPKKRYKVSGEFDAENRVMYYDMTTAVESA